MFYWLIDLSNTVPFLLPFRTLLNVFRYITFRTGGAMVTGALVVFLFGPWIIDNLRLRQGKGQPIRSDGPASHIVNKKGTPTMGGLMILSGLLVATLLWANPASMAAALNVLGAAPVGPQGRRIAVLGDMLELGPTAPQLHRGLVEAVRANHIDLVYCCGPLMRNLWDALSTGKRGGYAGNSEALESMVTGAIRAGDAIMVKGSLGSKMKTIVNALETRFPGRTAVDDIAV